MSAGEVKRAERPAYLLLEDDPAMARRYAGVLGGFGAVQHAATLLEARRLASAGCPWLGVVLDVRLPDGDGLDFLAELRQRGWIGSALIVTGWPLTEILHRAQQLNAFMLPKPAPVEGLRAFVRWTRLERERDRRLAEVVDARAAAWQLTPRERHVLELSVAGVSRSQLAAELRLGENTVKTHVRRLLRKAGFDALTELVGSLYRDLHRTGAPPADGVASSPPDDPTL